MGNAHTFKTDKIGFQVTSISPRSPGEKAGLKVAEDFILTMNGQDIPFVDPEQIMSTVKNSENRPVLLTVYNTSTERIRDVVLTPSADWPGEGLLGIKIKLNTYETSYIDTNFSNVYSREEEEEENSYEDIVKSNTPSATNKHSRNFSFGDSNFADFTDIGNASSRDRSGTSTPVTFKESLRRTFSFKK